MWSSQGGMGVCRHDQNEESSRDRGGAQTQQGKTNSAKNPRKTGKNMLESEGGKIMIRSF